MATTASLRLDTRQFDRVLGQYLRVSERAPAEIINRKAFFIARRAVVETPKANRAQFIKKLTAQQTVAEKLLGQKVRLTKTKGVLRGKMLTQKVKGAPLAALIINARRARQGLPGLSGAKMEEAINQLLAVRSKSVAFLKSGWLPAIRILEPHVGNKTGQGAPRMDYRTAHQIGIAKGSAVPARPGWNVRATIENAASARRDKKEALIKYGQPALQRAFDFEAHSTSEEVGRRLCEEGRRLGIRITGG